MNIFFYLITIFENENIGKVWYYIVDNNFIL